jgi:hypothetical protein
VIHENYCAVRCEVIARGVAAPIDATSMQATNARAGEFAAPCGDLGVQLV